MFRILTAGSTGAGVVDRFVIVGCSERVPALASVCSAILPVLVALDRIERLPCCNGAVMTLTQLWWPYS